MSPVASQRRGSRGLSARRLVLLATVASLGIGTVVIGLAPQLPAVPAHAAVAAARPAGFGDLAEKVKPAVIAVRVKRDASPRMMGLDSDANSLMQRFWRRFGLPEGEDMPGMMMPNERPSTGQGSGFFISADGYAVTNNHVVDKAQSLEIITEDGKTYAAKIVGSDPQTDIALIKVDGRSDFPFVTLADTMPRIGDWVLAVGNPFGLGGSVTAGIVSARGRDIGTGPYDDYLQIDASINRGNSGGPTFDMEGNVIGVNTAIFSPSGGSVGVAFAIPADTVKAVVAQLKDKGVVTRSWIGVQIQPVTAEIAEGLGMNQAEGALVVEPQKDGPAAKAGILAGDVITAVNGKPVKDARDLARQIGGMAPGSSARLAVWRKGEARSLTLTLAELPKQREARAEKPDAGSGDAPRLGMMLAPAAQVAGSGSEGVVVTEVEPDSIAAGRGLKTGDVIIEVAGVKVANPVDVRNAIADAHKNGKRSVLMRLRTDDAFKFVAVPLARA
jgi:serine protease Do